MALYTGRILMRIGNEANYDIDKLMPGEWAVSTDKRIVRICVSAGIGIRMATYEAFEEDMAKIEEILNQCQTIQEAVVRINTEVSKKADAVAEYTEQARNYRDESRQYAESALSSASDAKKSETNASGSAEQAQNSASSALTDAENAASSAEQAYRHATQAGNFAGIAENSALVATESSEQARQSETNAKASENNAKNSETNAFTSASNAKKSETNAASSAEQARNSLSATIEASEQAQQSATNSANSASNAKKSEDNAANSANNAKTSETNASNSALSAANSVEESRNSASVATEAAGKAQQSESNAKSSENNAKTSETNSASSAEQAQQSANTAVAAVEQTQINATKAASSAEQAKESANSAASAKIKNLASGENIHLTDSAGSKVVEFALYGNAKQNTTTGKNIAKVDNVNLVGYGLELKGSKDGTIAINGTCNNDTSLVPVVSNIVPKTTGLYKFTGSPTDNCLLAIYDSSNSQAYADETKSKRQNNFQGATNKELQYYLEANMTYKIMFLFEKVKFDNVILYPMIRPADTDDTFEPYTNGIAPNPEYPQEVEVAGASGSVVVKSCGKNILRNTLESQTVNNVSVTVNEDKTVKVNGTASVNTGFSVTTYLNKGKYIATGCPAGGSYTTYALLVQPLDATNTAITTYWDIGNGVVFDINEDNTKVWLYTARLYAGYTANNLLFKPMIRKCDENGNPIGDDTYEPYKETSATIPTPNGLAGIPVSSGGNYTDENGKQWVCDEIVKYSDGTGEYIQRITKSIENSATGYAISSVTNPNGKVFLRNVLDADPNILCAMSNKYTIISNVGAASLEKNQLLTTKKSDGNYGLYLVSDTANTVQELNAQLEKNPFEFYYVLKEPIRTPLTTEEVAAFENLYTFYPVTNISNDSECGMKVTYFADLKNYIDNQLALHAQAQEAAMVNMLLLLPEEIQAAMIENDTNNLLLKSEV